MAKGEPTWHWWIKESSQGYQSVEKCWPDDPNPNLHAPPGAKVESGTYDDLMHAEYLCNQRNFHRAWPRDVSKCSICGGPTPCLRND